MSKLIAKPKITERKSRIETSIVEGNYNFVLYKMHGFKKHRVDGGWKYYYGSHWEFVPDEIQETEIVEDEGGYLDLSNREIESLDEITRWFSNNELDEIIKMDLSNNNIQNIDELGRFKNLQEVNLSSNNISRIKNPEDFNYIDNIIVIGNPIANNTDLPINYTRDKISTCDRCGTTISYKYVEEEGNSLCESCLDEYMEELKERTPHSQAFLNALNGPPKRGCLGTVLLIISLAVTLFIF